MPQARGPPLPEISTSAELRRRVAAKRGSGHISELPNSTSADQERTLDREVPLEVVAFAANSADVAALFGKVRSRA